MQPGHSNLLEQSIFNTVRYFDILGMPVTATQIWECLVIAETKSAIQHVGLREIQQLLRQSPWLQEKLGTKWGYYFLPGKESSVTVRLERHALAQQKWKLARRLAQWLAVVPFVRGLAGSGSLALDNTRLSSDLDYFVIVQKKRIWTARLGLLIVSQLTGRRRKYWNVEAPDKICLNHYVSTAHLQVVPDIQNLFTAVAYTQQVPLWGRDELYCFYKENSGWIKRFTYSPQLPHLSHEYEITPPPFFVFLKTSLENFLLEPIGNVVERLAKRVQRWVAYRHQSVNQLGRIVLSDHELAFHPDTKVPAILDSFYSNN